MDGVKEVVLCHWAQHLAVCYSVYLSENVLVVVAYEWRQMKLSEKDCAYDLSEVEFVHAMTVGEADLVVV